MDIRDSIMIPFFSPTVLLTYLYFLQGVPYGLQARFLPIYFRAHGMSLSNIGFIKILFFPWMCKTAWAPFVDRFGKKKTWLLWSMMGLGATCVFTAGIDPSWFVPLCVALLVFNFLTSTQDIATDGLAIEILTSAQVASGNIAQVVGYKFGAIIGGGLLAWLSDHITWSAIFILLTVIYATAVVFIMLYIPEGANNVSEYTIEVSEAFPVKENMLQETSSPSADSSEAESPYPQSKNTRSKTKAKLHDIQQIKTSKLSKKTVKDITKKPSKQEENHATFFDTYSADCSVSEKTTLGPKWILEHFNAVLQTEGTVWILAYVMVYKLGEQGALNMMPMFLIDKGVPTADVGLWTGVVGQAVSIAGSILGGLAISSGRFTALNFLALLSVVKVMVLALETLTIGLWIENIGFKGFGTDPYIFLMLVLLVISGGVSTAAFTLMMQCSQKASPHCRASHYSLLATVEVLGKLMFSVFVGAITDAVGYTLAFGIFLSLSLVVLPLFRYAPNSLKTSSLSNANDSGNKDC